MNVPPIGNSDPRPKVATVPQPAKPSVAKDADGDHDGTKPGKTDMKDGFRAGRVNVRA